MENKLETPFGTLEVLRNGEAKDYRIKENDNNLFVPSEEEIDASANAKPMIRSSCASIRPRNSISAEAANGASMSMR